MRLATDILRREHDDILRMLDASEELTRHLAGGEPVAADLLFELVEYFRVFADRCHDVKEEDLLFPFLELKGLKRGTGPLGVLLDEHEEGRGWLRRMRNAAEAYRLGQPEAGREWADAAGAYHRLLRQHIEKENSILLLLADRLLSDSEQTALGEAFLKLEEEKAGRGTHARLAALMERLTAQLLPH
jgi:hemerythrin-like domain-containing protein